MRSIFKIKKKRGGKMGLFHKTLENVCDCIDKKEWDKAITILREHQEAHLVLGKNRGIVQRMIKALQQYQNSVANAIDFCTQAKNGNPTGIGAKQQIGFAQEALRQLKADIKKLLEERIKLE